MSASRAFVAEESGSFARYVTVALIPRSASSSVSRSATRCASALSFSASAANCDRSLAYADSATGLNIDDLIIDRNAWSHGARLGDMHMLLHGVRLAHELNP